MASGYIVLGLAIIIISFLLIVLTFASNNYTVKLFALVFFGTGIIGLAVLTKGASKLKDGKSQKIQYYNPPPDNYFESPFSALPKGIGQSSKPQNNRYEGLLEESDLQDNFARLEWKDAENLVGKLFEKKGFHTSVIGKTGDYGIDVEAKNGDSYFGIQVKHWTNSVGTEDVMKTLGGAHRFTKVIIISTKSSFTDQALQFALKEENKYRIELWDNARFKLELKTFILNK